MQITVGVRLLHDVTTAAALNRRIGEQILHKRKQFGYSREQLAEKLDLSWQYISNVECGHRGISLDTLIKLCELFQVSSDYFLFGQKASNDISEITELLSSINPKWIPHLKDVIISFITSCQDAVDDEPKGG